MFKLFSGKISGVLNLALQGISKVTGFVLETLTSVVDTVVETATQLLSPITESITDLPVIGDTLGSVVDLSTNLVGNLTDGSHAVADKLLQGELLGGITTAIEGVTPLVGQSIEDAVDVIENLVELTAPLTGLGNDLPVLGDVLGAVGETTSNLLGFVNETAEYVADIDPLSLLSGLSNPTGTIGDVVQDVSGTLDNLLNDLSPVTDLAADLPLVGPVVEIADQVTTKITDGLYDLGALIGQVDLLDPFHSNFSLI